MPKTIFLAILLIPVTYTAENEIKTNVLSPASVFHPNQLLSNIDNLTPGSKCRDHLLEYRTALTKFEEWALRMFDASAKGFDGVLKGHKEFLGNFDECLEIERQDFKGMHCLLNVELSRGATAGMVVPMMFGFCLPSTCTPKEIEDALEPIRSPILNVSLRENSCWTNDPILLDTDDWILLGFVVAILLMSVCSTVYDFKHSHDGTGVKRNELLSSFSLNTNFRQLFRISKSADNIGCLHGIRTLSICWVVLGHSYLTVTQSPAINSLTYREFINDPAKIPIINAIVSVDTFFLLSGLLVTLVFFRDIAKRRSYDVPMAMIHRYLRLTPSFAVMIWIESTIFRRLGRGPLWRMVVDFEAQICRDNWWMGLVYLQNFLNPSSTCLGQSWYLSADMQMFWLSPLLLYPMLFWKRLAPFLLILALLAAWITNFVVAYSNDLSSHGIFQVTDIMLQPEQFEIDYVQSYMRLTPYIIGMALGYLICGIKAKKIHINLSKAMVLAGWLLSTGLCLGSMYGLLAFMNTQLSTLENCLYLSLHRVGWSLGIAWVVFACINGYGGLVNSLLSWKGFQILGKLSYSVFLTHFTFQYIRIGMNKTNVYFSDLYTVFNFFGDLWFTTIFAIPLTVLIEMPCLNIERYFLQKTALFPLPRPKSKKEPEPINPGAQDGLEAGVENKGYQN